MNIVDVCGFYSETGGGVRSYVHHKLEAAARAGHDVTVIAPGAEDRVEPRRGGRIAWVKSALMPFDPNYRRFSGCRAVWSVLDAAAPDIIEGSSPWGSGTLAGGWPGRAVRALIFHQDFVAGYPYTAFGGFLSRPRIDALFAPYWAHLRRLSARFDVTVTGGAWLAERLAGFGVHNPLAVPFGIESGRFSPALRDESLRREMLALCGAPETGRLLLAVGRFHPEKRHRTIIEAFALARAARPDLALFVVGDGLARAVVERLARRHGGVHLAGAVADRDRLARIYASADALVHGSGAETYGLVVAEAIASGLPVVAPDVGGAAELARAAGSPCYPLGDARACAEAILTTVGAKRRASRAAAAGPSSSEAHFEALFALYERLIAERRAAVDAPARRA
jgi:alpha-1,6-mannosyltransferase